ncbi:SseB family protein [Yinghuangia sp. YIM S10712]|uniref:SseB family protein n=1 Tax=Yinghuangia sp. YIM S10712 TaxID=3436930 RepID=UPI003F53BC78
MRTDDSGLPRITAGGPASDDPSGLLDEIAKLLEGDGDPSALAAALLRTRLYCVRPEHVGFAAVGPAGAGFVPMFTSLEQLALFAEEPCDWFSAPGADLLRLLPDGYDIAVDLGGVMPVRLHAALWRESAGTTQTATGAQDD